MPTRSGAALILALVILSALLLLGLPFLFTQSSSLGGTRCFAYAMQAHIAQASAEAIGMAAGASAMDYHWRSERPMSPLARDEWTSLYWGLSGNGAEPQIRPLGGLGGNPYAFIGLDLCLPGKFSFNPRLTDSTLSGVSISDEHGKLDPNHLNVTAWSRLLAQVGIADWDDGTPPSPDVNRNQLALALGDLRFNRMLIPAGRLTRLDQLLLAHPPISEKLRSGLTRSELGQLAPYLSLHGLAQARSGIIDLGTVVDVVGSNVFIDSVQPGALLAHPVFPTLLGSGSVLVDADDDGNDARVSQLDRQSTALVRGRALAIEAPPSVNLHEASAVTRGVLFDVPAALPPPIGRTEPLPNSLTELAGLNGPNTLPILSPPDALHPYGHMDVLLRLRTNFSLLDPLGIVQDLGRSRVTPTMFGDPGASGPFQDGGSGPSLYVDPVTMVAKPTLDSGALTIHVSGGPLDRLTSSGYARLDGINVIPDGPGTEYITFSGAALPATNAGGAVDLPNVIRRVPIPAGTTPPSCRFYCDGLTLTFLGPRELPPLAINSPPVIAIEAAATAIDPAGHQTAQRVRRTVAQVVEQEYPLEARWERQSHFHATLAQRHGSLLASFPEPVDRIVGKLPGDNVSMGAPPTDPDLRIGVRPAVLRTPLTASHLTHDWAAPLAGKGADNDAVSAGPLGHRQVPSHYTIDDLFPEGLRLTASKALSWPFAGSNPSLAAQGFFAHPPTTNGTTVEISPRQFGFWVRPDASWTGRSDPVTLIEVRGPIANAGRPLSGETMTASDALYDQRFAEGSTEQQNYIALKWNSASEELVLSIGSGAIEHVQDYGPAVPGDDYIWRQEQQVGSSPAIDNSCLGSSHAYQPLAPVRPLNRIEHHFHLSGSSLTPGTWHLIQVAFTGTRPDHAAILVDGLAGRLVDDGTAATLDGDHFAMPQVRLVTPLPRSDLDFTTQGADVYRVDAIELSGPVAKVLPTRGMVRIGNEYISYQRRDGTTLRYCWRARRQNSVSAAKPAVTEAHVFGDPVFPGGYRTVVPFLYTGGNTLAQKFPNGDVGSVGSPHPYRVWATLDPTPWGGLSMSGTFVLPGAGDLNLVFTGDSAVIAQFPDHGFLMIGDESEPKEKREVAYFTRKSGSSGTVMVRQSDRWLTTPGWTPPGAPADRACSLTTPVELISAELAGSDPTIAGRFPAAGLIQFYDANGTMATHRVEWVQYQGLIMRNNVAYLLNYSGFDASQRGQGRTAFAARELGDPTFHFPPGTRVLPVQSNGRLVETGDVLTIARQKLSRTTSQQPWQIVVRYAEKDSWGLPDIDGNIPAADELGSFHTSNNQQRFAFCEALPAFLAFQQCHLLCWPCWTAGVELSSASALASPVDLLPWGNAWATDVLDGAGGVPTDDRRVYLGSSDDRDDGNDPARRLAQRQAPTVMAIDALWAGTQPSAGAASLEVTGITRNTGGSVADSTAITWMSSMDGLSPGTLADAYRTVLTIQGLPQAVGRLESMLASVGGEVLALRRKRDISNNLTDMAIVIGRALLGSTPRVHHGREPVIILPLGPVTQVNASFAPDDPEPSAPFMAVDAPVIMLMDPDGVSATTPELLMAPNGKVAPWLRGMYGTTAHAWTAGTGAPPSLVVGWWPRYPSALPAEMPSSWSSANKIAWSNARLRSRSYAWAGFPLRLHSSWFYAPSTRAAPVDAAGSVIPSAEVDLLDDGAGFFKLEVRALDAGFEWYNASLPISPMLVPSLSFNASDAFFTDHFRFPTDGVGRNGLSWKRNDPIPVDGAELRINWTCPTSTATSVQAALLDLALNNRAPMIGPIRLRCRSSTQVLSVESTR